MFSKACEYGIKAMIYIATQSLNHTRVKIGDVAKNSGSPEAFTAKILGLLTKHNIVNSLKGPYGGFEIDLLRMKQIKISEIVFAIDGDSIYNGCALGLSECNNDKPCPMHDRFLKVRTELKHMLETTTIYELATELKSGNSVLMK
ncbi:RrF2 family transcriptional regulator [Pedobacter flavus]|uniref:Rrf2 family transcriptional regulator n=1 Tax=Pedobacter flavus TaxID=3113906 RepID=A0ABU7H3D0_9SPHI|nr:Rrf2 family transcriptional regulator [Pedobacter sp. VNH31]MEE1885765.1 Rrf2 family transcriptional regulator [Pedobacter sp. VNH31]